MSVSKIKASPLLGIILLVEIGFLLSGALLITNMHPLWMRIYLGTLPYGIAFTGLLFVAALVLERRNTTSQLGSP